MSLPCSKMICGRLFDFEALGLDQLGQATRRAVAWIRSLPAQPAEGAFDLGDDVRALILRYPTTPVATGRFETHRRYVDLQYTISGAETLEWIPRASLVADGTYDERKDLVFYHGKEPAGSLVAMPGVFSIFTPLDAHRGGIRTGTGTTEVLKLVVKVPVAAFSRPILV